MATYLYTLEGFAASSNTTVAHRYNNETGVWQTLAAPPAPAGFGVGSPNITIRQEGTFDGSYWYVTLMDGKLYRYDPTQNSWSGALAAGTQLVASQPASGVNWYMASDGRFVYHWSLEGFRRYDPVADTLTQLQDISTGSWGVEGVLEYDGNDTLYAVRGSNTGYRLDKYQISTAAWTNLTNPPNYNPPHGFAFLHGRLWMIAYSAGFNGGTAALMYEPSTNTWWGAIITTRVDGTFNETTPYGEVDDSTIRFWAGDQGQGYWDYNVLASGFVEYGGVPPWTSLKQGANFCVARAFNAQYVWYLADGLTVATPSIDLGSITPGDTLNYELQVQTAVARSGGVTVSVPQLPTTDAAQPVTISPDGVTYGASFSTGALTANQKQVVWVKVAPSFTQTLGLKKTFNLRVVAN